MPVVLLDESVPHENVYCIQKLASITPEVEVHRIEGHTILALLMVLSYELEYSVVSSANGSYEVGHNCLSARKNIAQ
ncbi:hypothetical protein [Gimesia aquarii]|uniref:Uncharacterized protein n=1 Tax=Gimesia aquarii TaxID=2527964 RepID=A0A517VTG5_9PLAN|nr:hypothetical protein [Gimesia aquarii]QDT96295.1 hypothetical protein V144x_17490 [Gimesia aquarii]